VFVVDFDAVPTTALVDANGDGVDDRVLETIELAGNTNCPLLLVPELGLAFAGAVVRALTSIAVAPPEVVALADADGDGPAPRQATRLAPYGVPTAGCWWL
jgi:hypothetical protein